MHMYWRKGECVYTTIDVRTVMYKSSPLATGWRCFHHQLNSEETDQHMKHQMADYDYTSVL